MLLGLQSGIVYGPVQSRRLGSSLGVNLLPGAIKLCTFDCLYCQYGWTGAHASSIPQGIALPSVDDVVDAVRNALALIDSPPAYITFSGNGEPTLHPEFAGIVDRLIEVRDRCSSDSEIAILSNSTTAGDADVRAALARLDARIMKLDGGTAEMMRRFNRPCAGIELNEIVEGLALLEDVTIQALFAGGEEGNAGPDSIAAWIECVRRIGPSLVQIYTLARDYPSRGIAPLSRKGLLTIASRLEAKGIRACVF